MIRNHRKCNKSYHTAHQFTGRLLNAFLGNDSIFEENKIYQFCYTLRIKVQHFKVLLTVRQSSIRRSYESSNGAHKRMMVLSTNKHMQTVYETYQLIVEFPDPALKVEKC